MAKSYLTTTEKKYLDFIKRKDEGFKQLNFDVGHIFKEELKDSIFYYFKKLLDLRHYDPDSISYGLIYMDCFHKSFKNRLLLSLSPLLVKLYSGDKTIETPFGSKDLTYQNEQILTLVLALENFTENQFNGLMYCVKENYLEGVQYFVERGCDVNYTGVMHKTRHNALSLAIVHHHNDIAKYLIEHGANIFQTINKNFFIEDLLDLSVHCQNFDIAEKLINLGLDVNWINLDKNSMNETRMMKIVSCNHIKTKGIMDFYLSHGFNLFETVNSLDQSLLTVATKYLNFELMILALKNGNNQNHVSSVTQLSALDYIDKVGVRIKCIEEFFQERNIIWPTTGTEQNIDSSSFFNLLIQILEIEQIDNLLDMPNHINKTPKKIKI